MSTTTITGSATYRSAFDKLITGQAYNPEHLADASTPEGHQFPLLFANTWLATMKRVCPLYRLANTEKVPSRHTSLWVNNSTLTAAWTLEGADITATAASSDFTRFKLTPHKLASLAVYDQALITDQPSTAQLVIASGLATALAEVLEATITGGNTTMGITGLTGHADRAQTGTLDTESITSMFLRLDAKHRANAVWVVGDETALQLATAPTNNGVPVLNLDTMRMCGKHVVISPTMPAPTAGSIPVALVDPARLRITQFGEPVIQTLTERYALAGRLGYLATSYFDITLETPEALTLLQHA